MQIKHIPFIDEDAEAKRFNVHRSAYTHVIDRGITAWPRVVRLQGLAQVTLQ
jgi:hypothetical protein